MSNPSEILSNKVKEWLNNQGYSLEMRVAQVFTQAGFDVSQFERYLDPDTGDLREIDIVATIKKSSNKITASIKYYIECKYLKNPWVIFTSKKRMHPLSYFSRILFQNYVLREWQQREYLQGRLLSRLLMSIGADKINQYESFTMPLDIGYNITQALRQKHETVDLAYIACSQVSQCIEAHDKGMEESFHQLMEDYERRRSKEILLDENFSIYCDIAFPLLVVQGNLFECYLGSLNKPEVREVNNGTLQLNSKGQGVGRRMREHPMMIKIITEDNITTFAKIAYKDASSILDQQQALLDILENEYSIFTHGINLEDVSF